MEQFAHLHCHSEYSLLDAVGTIKKVVNRACELEFPAIAITDHGSLAGIPIFLDLARSQGIKPVVGLEAYISNDSSIKDKTDKRSHILLLVKNEIGFKNLLKLSSYAWTKGFYFDPRIDIEILQNFSEGLIVLTACIGGEIPKLILENKLDEAKVLALKYKTIFGSDFYFEIQPHDIKELKIINNSLIQLSKELKIPLVATNDVHYLFSEEHIAHDALLMIRAKTTIKNRKKDKEKGKEIFEYLAKSFWLKSRQEMYQAFKENHNLDEELLNSILNETFKINEKIETFSLDKAIKFPAFDTQNKSFEEYLLDECKLGWKRKIEARISKQNIYKYEDRFKYEFDIISYKNFIPFFLIIADLIKWSKNQNILVGSGRGSCAASLIAYLMNITTIDPIEHNLIFDRFISKTRETMPDFDLDFQHNRRDEVKKYLVRKYGEDRVANIGAYGTLSIKAAIRDICRVYDIDLSIVNKICKDIGYFDSVDSLYENNETYKKLIKENSDIHNVIKAIEGQRRHFSRHPAGVIITPTDLDDFVALRTAVDAQKRTAITEWPEDEEFKVISSHGFLKIDILGLRTLSVVQSTLDDLNKDASFIEFLDLNDDAIYELAREGKTYGTFQFESSGIQELLQKIKPTKFKHLVDCNALYRPGPIDSGILDKYVERRNNGYEFNHAILEEVLGKTYGLIVFQEDTMNIMNRLAGLSFSEAEDIRKALTKWHTTRTSQKREDDRAARLMKNYEDRFLEGCRKYKIDQELAQSLWNQMLAQTRYSFNLPHATSYAMLAYQCLFLKKYYTLDYMTNLLSLELSSGTDENLIQYLYEACKLGIKILPVDINKSQILFSKEGDSIRAGLLFINGLGTKIAEELIVKRPFYDINDLISRVEKRKVNSKVLKALICSGALDSFGKDRKDLYKIVTGDIIDIDNVKIQYLKFSLDVFDFFDELENKVITKEKFKKERNAFIVAGIVERVTVVHSKRGLIAFVNLSFKDRKFSCLFWNKAYNEFIDILREGKFLVCLANKNDYKDYKNDYKKNLSDIMNVVVVKAMEYRK